MELQLSIKQLSTVYLYTDFTEDNPRKTAKYAFTTQVTKLTSIILFLFLDLFLKLNESITFFKY